VPKVIAMLVSLTKPTREMMPQIVEMHEAIEEMMTMTTSM
jgi:hypothetical protein